MKFICHATAQDLWDLSENNGKEIDVFRFFQDKLKRFNPERMDFLTIDKLDLWGMRFSNLAFNKTKLSNNDLEQSVLENATFTNSLIEGNMWKDAHINNVTFKECTIKADFRQVKTMENVTFENCTIENTIFYNKDAVTLKDCTLTETTSITNASQKRNRESVSFVEKEQSRNPTKKTKREYDSKNESSGGEMVKRLESKERSSVSRY